MPHGGWSDIILTRQASSGGSTLRALLDDGEPFVLLDDARHGGTGLVYRAPLDVITASTCESVLAAFERADEALRSGFHVAGYIGYEAGFALEQRLAPIATGVSDWPALWLGVFRSGQRVSRIECCLPKSRQIFGAPRPDWDIESYCAAVRQVLAYIHAGDLYQANLTFPTRLSLSAHPLAHYAHLRRAQTAGWGAVVFTGKQWLLSCSPELFFTLEQGQLFAKPMKGTAARVSEAAEDRLIAERLRLSPKDRAENLMIVDLLRNDLSRIAIPGSITVPSLFDVESYPTVFQMTSSVSGKLRPEMSAVDVLRAAFPCGSVTGAPKIRAMQIISQFERRSRGPYTGSIGAMSPAGHAAFNVVIRTLENEVGSSDARLCVGSGIVADSVPAAEWSECLAKAAFARG